MALRQKYEKIWCQIYLMQMVMLVIIYITRQGSSQKYLITTWKPYTKTYIMTLNGQKTWESSFKIQALPIVNHKCMHLHVDCQYMKLQLVQFICLTFLQYFILLFLLLRITVCLNLSWTQSIVSVKFPMKLRKQSKNIKLC